MTQLQKALDYIDDNNYSAYFELMIKIVGKNNTIANLENEYQYQFTSKS
jgi:hypothetical protein